MSDLLKIEIKAYRYYLERREELKDKIDAIHYELTGVKGIRYDKQATSYNPHLAEEKRLDLIEQKDRLEKELKRIEAQISYIEGVIGDLDDEDKKLVEILLTGETLRHAGRRLYQSSPNIYYHIQKLLKKIEL